MGSCWLQLKEVRGGIAMGDNVDVDAEEILEMSTEKLDEMSERKKKNSLLNEVLVTGLLKNINEKVSNKLDTDAQSELINIINERVKDGYKGGPIDLESEIEKAISFDEEPTDDHIISTANKNRAKLPANRRLPSKESKLSFNEIEEQIDNSVDADKVDEDFDNLFNDDAENEAYHQVDEGNKDIMEKSIIDDFDALLEDNNDKEFMDTDTTAGCNVEDDFDALLMAENIQIDSTKKIEISSDKDETETKEIDNEEYSKKSKEEQDILSIEDFKEKDLDDGADMSKNTNEILEEKEEENNIESEIVKQLVEDQIVENDANGKSNMNDSIEDIFKNLENNETNLLEIENMLKDESLGEIDSKTKIEPETKNDPFDDLFEELNEENMENVDKGFQQLYENKKTNPVEDMPSLNVDIDGNVFKTQEKNCMEVEVGKILGTEEESMIADTVGTQIVKDEEAAVKEDVNVKEKENVEESYNQGQGVPYNADEKIENKQDIEEKESAMLKELENYKMKVEQLEKEKEKLQYELKLLNEKQCGLEINKNGKKVIVPTENHDQETLDEEIRNDTREAELLIQLKHLSERVEVQDTLLAETKEDNTVLRIQNQTLLESLNKANATSKSKKKSFETPSLDWIDGDDSIEKKRLFLLEQELEDQKEVNKQLKAYVGDILINIIVQNPQILEKKQ